MHRPWIVAALAAALLGIAISGLRTAAAAGDTIDAVIDTFEVPELVTGELSPGGSLMIGTLGTYPEVDRWCLLEIATGELRWCIDPPADWEPLAVSPAWMPDGSAVFVSERPPQDADIWRIDAATGEATDLTDDGYTGPWPKLRDALQAGDPPLLFDAFPVVSPDGSAIAFTRVALSTPDETSASLQILPIPGGTPAQVVALDVPVVTTPAWSRDGRWLHWIEDGAGATVIGSATVDGTRSRRVRISSATDTSTQPEKIQGVLADGRLLMVREGAWFGDAGGWLVDPVTGEAELLLAESFGDPSLLVYRVTPSPDGRTVAAVVSRDGTPALELTDVTTGAVRRIPLPDLQPTREMYLRWLTDGRIAMNADPDHPRRHQAITLPLGWRSDD